MSAVLVAETKPPASPATPATRYQPSHICGNPDNLTPQQRELIARVSALGPRWAARAAAGVGERGAAGRAELAQALGERAPRDLDGQGARAASQNLRVTGGEAPVSHGKRPFVGGLPR